MNIDAFRKRFATLLESQKQIGKKHGFEMSLNAPCQVVVLEISSGFATSVAVMHNANIPDESIIALEKVSTDEIYQKLTSEPRLLRWTGEKVTALLARNVHMMTSDAEKDKEIWLRASIDFPLQKGIIYVFRGNLLYSADPYVFSNMLFEDMMHTIRRFTKKQQLEKIEEAVTNIKKEAETIPKTESRDRIITSTVELEKSMKRVADIDRKQEELEHEMSGVRRLIGSRTFGEWKVLLAEMDKMNVRIDSLSKIQEAYEKVLAQQADVMKQQAGFVTWIKYSTILMPIAVISIPIIEIVRILLGIR
jgi:hypothetical protein